MLIIASNVRSTVSVAAALQQALLQVVNRKTIEQLSTDRRHPDCSQYIHPSDSHPPMGLVWLGINGKRTHMMLAVQLFAQGHGGPGSLYASELVVSHVALRFQDEEPIRLVPNAVQKWSQATLRLPVSAWRQHYPKVRITRL